MDKIRTAEEWAEFYKISCDENGLRLDDVFQMVIDQARSELLDDLVMMIDLRVADHVATKGVMRDMLDELHFIKRRINSRRPK